MHQQVAQLLSEDPEAALRPATDAWQLANELNLPIELARTQSDLGKIYLQLGNYQHALQYLAEVEKTYRIHQQRIPLAQTQLLLAEVSNLQEDFAAAGNYLNSARGTIELADDPLWLAEWNLQMAIRYQGLQQYEKAATLYDRVIPILQRASTNNESLLMTAYEKDFQVRQLYNPVSELKQSNYYAWFTLLVSGAVLLVILGLLYYRIARLNRQHKEELKTKVSQQTQELQATNEALAEANAELQRFAYISSHDLKEPLRNIASFTTLIKRKMANHLDSDTEEYFQFVSRNTRQIADLVTDIFEYSSLNEKDIFFSYVD
ncbi:MAG: histidine kinase dimerization/phospho-acceptor domain-containing protein, partial [Bacteroidota bacterium]